MTEGENRCRCVLHIDWDADPVPVREDIARCELLTKHPGRQHTGRDVHGKWWTW